MAQALLNLTLNAVQAGARNVRIRYGRVAPEQAGAPTDGNHSQKVFVDVIDDGPGFPENVLAKAGEPFVTTRPDGSGLGLAVVYQVVRAHGGDVEIGAVEPHGARVRLLLPVHSDGRRAQTRSTKS
jgi:signal transduction histidine kinase